ncbi:uncharacterized protein LOC141905431 isoform X2 [Tubulanus polymorphus]|uniref:uncharacterized protein LOC141905431 isoform X2 n=1 Tax=Tubulanus polymorphus TaxID=672921 RepID=UPI003DA1EE06
MTLMYYQIKDKPYRTDLNHQIMILSRNISSEIDLDSLKTASQMMKKVLIQNPHLPELLFGLLLDQTRNESDNCEILFSCARLKSDFQTTRQLMNKLTVISAVDTDPWMTTLIQTQAELFNQHLIQLLKHNSGEFESAVDKVIDGDKENGLAVVVECLRIKSFSNELSSLCKDKLLHYIIYKAFDSESNFLWDLSTLLNISPFHLHKQLTDCKNIVINKQQTEKKRSHCH